MVIKILWVFVRGDENGFAKKCNSFPQRDEKIILASVLTLGSSALTIFALFLRMNE